MHPMKIIHHWNRIIWICQLIMATKKKMLHYWRNRRNPIQSDPSIIWNYVINSLRMENEIKAVNWERSSIWIVAETPRKIIYRHFLILIIVFSWTSNDSKNCSAHKAREVKEMKIKWPWIPIVFHCSNDMIFVRDCDISHANEWARDEIRAIKWK